MSEEFATLQDAFGNYLVYWVEDKHAKFGRKRRLEFGTIVGKESLMFDNVRAVSAGNKNKSLRTSGRRSSDRHRSSVNYIKPLPRRLSRDIIGKPLISIQGSLHARSFCQGDTDEGEGRRGRTIPHVARGTFNSSAPAEYLINRALINDALPF